MEKFNEDTFLVFPFLFEPFLSSLPTNVGSRTGPLSCVILGPATFGFLFGHQGQALYHCHLHHHRPRSVHLSLRYLEIGNTDNKRGNFNICCLNNKKYCGCKTTVYSSIKKQLLNSALLNTYFEHFGNFKESISQLIFTCSKSTKH